MAFELTPRQRGWLDALLILGVAALGLIVLGGLIDLFFYFGDVVLVFFLAWLVAFVLSPMVDAVVKRIPRLPRTAAVGLVYLIILSLFVLIVLLIAGALASGISDFINNRQQILNDLPRTLAPWQARLDAIGLGQVRLIDQANSV